MNTEVFDLGKIGITLGGEYDNKVIYEKLTIVLYKGKSYISTKTTQGVSPEQDILVWQLVAEAKDAYNMLVDAGKTTLTEEEFLEQLVDATKGRYIVQGNITNAADEEDLTVEHSDLLGIDTLKLANRDNTNGMGYIILRKNKSFAEQVTKENTIYEIRYDFSIPSNFSIPKGCKFFFNGGNVIGGSLVGNLMNSELDYAPNMTPSIIQCMPSGSIVRLHADIVFSTSDPVGIKCNILGNGHKVSFSSVFSYFNILADNVTISEVKLVNDNTTYDREARVIRCDNHSNLTITKCFIGAGVTMYNHYKDVEIGGLTITDNIIDVDYSERMQDTISQADVFYILGIKNVLFARNRGKVKNICRFFKTQDAPNVLVPPAPKGISNNASENIVFENNYIVSECRNGKQFWDMYDGSVNVVIRHNIIKATGHTMIFEDKTNLTFYRDSSRRIDIYNNEIWYDSSLMLTLNNIKGEQVYFNNNVIYNTSGSTTRKYMENGVELTESRERMLYFTNTSIVEVCNNKFFNPYDTITGHVVMKSGTSKSIKFDGNYVENYAGIYHLNDTDIVECNENYFANSGSALLEVTTDVETTALVKSIIANNNTIGSKYTLIDNVSRVTINKVVAIGNIGNTLKIVSEDVDNLISDGVLLQTITGELFVSTEGVATTSRWLNHEFVPTKDKLEILITGNVTWIWQLVVDTTLKKLNFQFTNLTDVGQNANFIIKHYAQKTI